MSDNMTTLDMIQRLTFFFVGFALGRYVTQTGKTDLQVYILLISVYAILVLLYFVAKAIVEQHT